MQHTDVVASAETPPQAWRKRENLWSGLALVVLTVAAWVYTIYQASTTGSMNMGDLEMTGAMGQLGGLVLFLFGWMVMMVAMMLPAMLPLILLYRVVTHKCLGQFQALAGIAVLLVGYTGIWTVAGLPVYGYDLLATKIGSSMALLPSLLLIAGGIYQLTALKRGCHTRCSNPLSFLMQQWRPGTVGALRLGGLHGIDCLGCCAGLMVGLVGLGMMNLAVMLSAAVIIFIEKTLSGGHRITRPLGVLMITGGVVLLGASLFGGKATMSM